MEKKQSQKKQTCNYEVANLGVFNAYNGGVLFLAVVKFFC